MEVGSSASIGAISPIDNHLLFLTGLLVLPSDVATSREVITMTMEDWTWL